MAITVSCAECGKSISKLPCEIARSKSGKSFCTKSCSVTHKNKLSTGKRHPQYKHGKGTQYRKTAFYHHGIRCMSPNCPFHGIVPEKMLDVDHIDGDRSNNALENLQVLCVWCHALKTRKIELNYISMKNPLTELKDSH